MSNSNFRNEMNLRFQNKYSLSDSTGGVFGDPITRSSRVESTASSSVAKAPGGHYISFNNPNILGAIDK